MRDSRNLEETFQDFLCEVGWFTQPRHIRWTHITDGVWSPPESGLHSPESESESESKFLESLQLYFTTPQKLCSDGKTAEIRVVLLEVLFGGGEISDAYKLDHLSWGGVLRRNTRQHSTQSSCRTRTASVPPSAVWTLIDATADACRGVNWRNWRNLRIYNLMPKCMLSYTRWRHLGILA